MCTTMSLAAMGSEDGDGSLGSDVKDSCELPCEYWELHLFKASKCS